MITLLGQNEPTASGTSFDRASFTPSLPDTFAHAPAALAVTTLAGTIITANAALTVLLGRGTATLVGATLLEMTHPDDIDGALRCDALLPTDGRISRGERRLCLDDGRVIWVSLGVARLPRPAGRPEHLVVHVDDVTDRREREADLAHRALHDPLTGLGNRALLLDRLTAAIAQLDRHDRPSHLFYLDLDGFKPINDRFGHAAGDAVLVQLAERVGRLLRVGDTAVRLGGDEFAVLCEDAAPVVADSIVARLRDAAAQPFLLDATVDATTVALSASVGHCPVRTGATPDQLLRHADQLMYQAKRRRKHRPTDKLVRNPSLVPDDAAISETDRDDKVATPTSCVEPTFVDLMGDFGLTTPPLSRRRLIRRRGRRDGHHQDEHQQHHQ